MPNVIQVLRAEITRLARKEDRVNTRVLKRSSAQHRRDIAALKREVAALQRTVALFDKQLPKGVIPAARPNEAGKFRFVAKGLKTQRRRLGLSAKDYGTLIGVSGLTVYNWESEKARPRAKHIPLIAALRTMGKREVTAKLAKAAR